MKNAAAKTKAAAGLLVLITLFCSACETGNTDRTLRFSAKQTEALYQSVRNQEGRLPRSADAEGNLVTSGDDYWCSGFTAGTLWYLYEYTRDDRLKAAAEDLTRRVERQQYTTDNHDVGFMVGCSYGNAYRLTGCPEYRAAVVNAARSLATRFDPVRGVIRSWDHPQWHFPVIIDNMMNLELLCEASRLSGDPSFRTIALSHADTTLKYHFRPDGSSCHVVDYGVPEDGAYRRQTHQGYADGSAWARGQAWALYGYTMMFRETRKPEYRAQAMKIARFILGHPRLPADKIPYWDFDAPGCDGKEPLRDASAGAIIASALLELSTFAEEPLAETYREAAKTQVATLASPAYLATAASNAHFILRHSVGHFPHRSEIDVPLTYADYYFVEALLRMKQLKIKF
ncbi:MAG: glycoside hydrolase family 88 protein [Dysgonamonadaceae bacterium]|jgi:hypothetical protein|nr:glycoside hydrolase family 88 protein [Dysgonamonadaceae bacterium]